MNIRNTNIDNFNKRTKAVIIDRIKYKARYLLFARYRGYSVKIEWYYVNGCCYEDLVLHLVKNDIYIEELLTIDCLKRRLDDGLKLYLDLLINNKAPNKLSEI